MARRPTRRSLAAGNPLVARLHEATTVRLSHATALSGGADVVSDAMIALGGEAAAALGSDGVLAGLLVLGPKRSGMPYEDEEMAFLGALELGRHARPPLRRHPGDPREPQPGAAGQG